MRNVLVVLLLSGFLLVGCVGEFDGENPFVEFLENIETSQYHASLILELVQTADEQASAVKLAQFVNTFDPQYENYWQISNSDGVEYLMECTLSYPFVICDEVVFTQLEEDDVVTFYVEIDDVDVEAIHVYQRKGGELVFSCNLYEDCEVYTKK